MGDLREKRLPAGTERARLVREMFDRIAGRYELLNTVMTAGLNRLWNREVIRATGLRAGDKAIDLACGTGSLTRDLAKRVGRGGGVLGIDFSKEMLRVAQARPAPNVEYRLGDATNLEGVPSGVFDAFYGLWFDKIVPRLGARISGDAWAYSYLPESVKEFVAPDELSDIMERNGLQDVTWRGLAGGIITLHSATRRP